MARGGNDDYDGFQMMVNEISRFNDQYRSFTTGKIYTDLLGKTASGLLKDAAAETGSLSAQDIKQHKYSLEVFAAFCMYFCLTQIKSSFRNVDLNLAQDAVCTVYGRILKRIKRDLEEKGECRFVRNLIKCSAINAMLDLIREESRYVPARFDDEAPEKPDKELGSVPQEIWITLGDGAADAMEKQRKLATLTLALAQAKEKGILTQKELQAVCHYFEFGDGFKKLSNHEIALKLGCSDPHATELRKNGLRKLYDYIRNTPELGEEIL